MSVLRFIFGALLFVLGAVLVSGIMLASPLLDVTDTFAGLSYDFIPFLVIGLVGLILILTGFYIILTSRQ